MTEQQWNEFLDKLDFAQLSGRWELLPLRWLDEDLPDSLSELARDLAQGLLELREEEDEEARIERVKAVCAEYRTRLSGASISLDARLCPPGSRVTLSYLDPENLGSGDCLITVGAWDRLGYLLAEAAHPDAEHLENVGDNPVRQEPGKLAYRHLLLFPDKGVASPRAFRGLCEKTLRQARGLGARHLAVTHLHLPQTGLADRFAAAELVSALRQMLRESPGTTVDILAFSHRTFQDYVHWFQSLKELARGDQEEPEGYLPDSEGVDNRSEVTETLRNFARRSSALASEATASVRNWFTEGKSSDALPPAWGELSYPQQLALNQLFLKRLPEETYDIGTLNGYYLDLLHRTVQLESEEEGEEARAALLQDIERGFGALEVGHPLARYFRLLSWRNSPEDEPELLQFMLRSAEQWDDRPLQSFLRGLQEDTAGNETNLRLPPVYPAGSRAYPEA